MNSKKKTDESYLSKAFVDLVRAHCILAGRHSLHQIYLRLRPHRHPPPFPFPDVYNTHLETHNPPLNDRPPKIEHPPDRLVRLTFDRHT